MPIQANVTNNQITASVGETQIDVNVSGGVGPTGTTGAAATVTVGTVTTGAPGSSASVVNAGTSSAAILNFTIPAGSQGATGATGPAGPAGTTSWNGITDKPSTFAPSAHTHDDRYYTEAEVDTLLAAKAPIASPTFTGTVSGVTNAMVGLGNVPNVDATARANHTGSQAISTVSGLQTALDGKAATNHAHGNLSSAGLVNGNTTSGQIVVTTTGGALTTAAQIDTAQVHSSNGGWDLNNASLENFLGNLANNGLGDAVDAVGGLDAGSVTGLATVATSGNAADLTGTLNAARLPSTTVTAGSYGSASSVATYTVDAAGRLTAAGSTAIAISAGAVSGLATVATSGSYNDLANKPTIPSAYTLPTASATVLGGVKIGSGLSIDGSSVLSTTYSYTLPNATTSTLGGVIVGTGLGVTSGTVSVSYGTTSGTACQGNDSRLSDARTPTSHASSHASGGSDAISIAASQITSGTVSESRLPVFLHPFLLAGM